MANIPRPGTSLVDVAEDEFRKAIAACPDRRYQCIEGVEGAPHGWAIVDGVGDVIGFYRSAQGQSPERFTLLR